MEQSLKRLRTDYVDIYFNHAVNDVARMQNQEWWKFTALAKIQGKIRFRGMSGHDGCLVEGLDYAIDKDLVDVILVAYNFGHDPKFVTKFATRFIGRRCSRNYRACSRRRNRKTSASSR